MTESGSVDLFWIPVGAGGRVVPRTAAAYERLAAWRERRAPQPLFHSALRLSFADRVETVEMAPVWSLRTWPRGVVVTGPVGARPLGRSPLFRYEVRCWSGGEIPDADYAVPGPIRLATGSEAAGQVRLLAPRVPALTWGRDELGLGDMWNSNSVIAWLLVRAGLEGTALDPPAGGRAPGWQAGLEAGRSA